MNYVLSPEVREAVAAGSPVVALESSVIAQGLPYPTNLETALRVQDIIRRMGAVPATIAIIGGKVRIGLERREMEMLADPGSEVEKAGLDFLPAAVELSLNAATTVATTAYLAARVGVRVFVTGGIGGVHRGFGETLDISGDMLALARTDIGVVCAGAKSILDIPATLELLESLGVTTVGYRTDWFPGFYTVRTGERIRIRVDEIDEIAAIMRAKWELCRGTVLIANPIPEEFSLEAAELEGAIEEALREAAEKGIRGKDLTPFLLSRISVFSSGKSLAANQELLYNNARLGALLAKAYFK